MTYELHPLCTLFPRMAGPEFDALKADIRKNGLREPITMHDGMVLDGGNRYRACTEAGVPPVFAQFQGDDVVAYVLSANLHRRHLTAGQHAAIVASVTNWAEAASVGRPKSGNVATLSTIAGRAAAAGVSQRTQGMADAVAKADPELARGVARGETTLPKAARQIAAKPGNTATLPDLPTTPPAGVDEVGDLLEQDMAELRKRNAVLEAENAALGADDQRAETLRWRRQYDHATSQAAHAQARAKEVTDKRDWYAKQLRRCGKAVGQEDPDKIAAAVEAFVRNHKPATAKA